MFSNLFIFSDPINSDLHLHKIKTDRNYSDSPSSNIPVTLNFSGRSEPYKSKGAYQGMKFMMRKKIIC